MDIGIASHDLNEPRPEAPTNSTIPGPQIHGGRLLVGPGQSEYQSRIPSPSSILSSSPTTASPSIRSRLYSPPHSQGFTPPSLSPLSTPEMGNATLRSPSFSPSEDPSLPSECLTQHQDQEMAKDLVHEGGTAASPGAYRGESSSQEPVIDEVKAREGSWESVDVRPTPANFWDSEIPS
ncbi:hypothetical protein BS47DRAFT_646949 [Hydnum rufescens UP504]|uniref:Uncharacterized protein n=1 Tax=Hydnum rufescens UP504 TaxID=1448309 RepID=A0A9P6BA69_9AGAM|nr:hypothetical protein BS47DRAFT_646949 [Hydnum rufescens UP504]